MSGNWTSLVAQCVMCYRTAAAQQGERARVLNSGILILLVPPLLVLSGVIALAWWKSRWKSPNRVPAQAHPNGLCAAADEHTIR
jgi:hypothetical protein